MRKHHLLIPVTELLALTFIVACGASAPDPADSPSADQPAAKQDAPKDQPAAPTAVPAAKAQPTKAPAMALKPAGTLNMGQEEINVFSGHPKLSVNPQLFVISTAPVVEGLMAWDSNLVAVPLLLKSWSISDDFLTWTFNIHLGLPRLSGHCRPAVGIPVGQS